MPNTRKNCNNKLIYLLLLRANVAFAVKENAVITPVIEKKRINIYIASWSINIGYATLSSGVPRDSVA